MVGHLGREVAGDDVALVRVGDKGEDALAVGVDGIVETVLKSLRLSCGSELTRQGISLP